MTNSPRAKRAGAPAQAPVPAPPDPATLTLIFGTALRGSVKFSAELIDILTLTERGVPLARLARPTTIAKLRQHIHAQHRLVELLEETAREDQ